MANYHKEREREVNHRIREIRDDLPEFTDEFFIGIEPRTTSLTRLNYAYDLRIFFDYLTKEVRCCKNKAIQDITLEDLAKITSTHLESYMAYLSLYEYEGKEYSNGDRGKARKIATVRTFFKYFFNKDKLPADVASKITLPKLREKEIIRLEPREIEKILDAAYYSDGMSEHQKKILESTKARDVAILSLLLGTGIRVSELVGLNINDDVKEALLDYVDFERPILIQKSKKLDIDEEPLFLSLQVKRICVRAVENLVKKYAAIATPLKKISPHKLRSTYGTNLYRETGDIYMVADVLGHRDVNTTKKHYAAIEIDRRKAAAKAVTLHSKNENDD